MVGGTRIELATSRPPDVRATAAPTPDIKMTIYLYGQGDRTWTDGLSVPNAARYQLRHTQKNGAIKQQLTNHNALFLKILYMKLY